MRIAKIAFVLLLMAVIPSGLLAQETTSEIQGVVMDGNNGLANATILAVQPSNRYKVRHHQP